MEYETIATQTETELVELRQRIVHMGSFVSDQVNDAVRAFVSGDTPLAAQVRARDKEVNAMELALDHKCTEFIARRQPAASDLRSVLASSKVIENLERVGDEAKTIAKITELIASRGELERGRVPDVEDISRDSLTLLRASLQAYASLDAPTAHALLGRIDPINEKFQGLARQMLTHMMEKPQRISWGLDVMRLGRAAARIGELAGHVAEHTIYMAEARDVRHHGLAEAGGAR